MSEPPMPDESGFPSLPPVPPDPGAEPASETVTPADLPESPADLPGSPEDVPGSPEEGAAAAPEPARRGKRIAAIAVAAVLVVGGSAAAAAFFLLRGHSADLLSKVPAGADMVVVAELDPAASQKINLFRMTEKFPSLGNEDRLQQRVSDLLDQALKDAGIGHADLAWVGTEIAIEGDFGNVASGGTPDFAVLVDSKDDAGARAMLEKLSRSGGGSTHTVEADGVVVTVSDDGSGAYTLFDHTVVAGSSQQAVQNIVRTARGNSPSLQASTTFQSGIASLPEARLGLMYVDLKDLMKTMAGASGAAFPPSMGVDPRMVTSLAMSVSAEPDGLAFDMVTNYDPSVMTPEMRAALSAPDRPNALLPDVPPDAYLTFAVPNIDATIGQAVDQFNALDPTLTQQTDALGLTGDGGLLSQLSGDFVVEVSPGAALPVGGTLMLGTKDPTATAATAQHLLDALLGGNPKVRWGTETHRGVTVTFLKSGAPVPVAWAIVDGAVVVGMSPADVERVVDVSLDGGGLVDSAAFKSATASVPTTDSLMYLDMSAVLAAIRSQLDPTTAGFFDQQVGKDLAPIKAVVAGSEGDEHSARARLFIRIP